MFKLQFKPPYKYICMAHKSVFCSVVLIDRCHDLSMQLQYVQLPIIQTNLFFPFWSTIPQPQDESESIFEINGELSILNKDYILNAVLCHQ